MLRQITLFGKNDREREHFKFYQVCINLYVNLSFRA